MSRRLRHRIRAAVPIATLATALLPTAVTPVGAVAYPAETSAVVPAALDWQPCKPPELEGLECANQEVPLSYAKPGGKQITLALSRLPAADQAKKKGSLFLNPGGPGGTGLGLPAFAESFLSPAVLASYDIVGFDPRGIGESAPIQCFRNDEAFEEVLGAVSSVPISSTERRTAIRAYGRYTKACGKNGGPLLNHISTLNVVRDLDMMREAVGDKLLNYVGFSYGTLIGATYANVYAKNVGRVVIDGNVDPRQRTNDRVANLKDRAGGFETALDGFLTACKAVGRRCGFSKGSPRAKFDAIMDQLRQGPIDTGVPENPLTLTIFTEEVSGALYDITRLASLAKGMQTIYDLISTDTEPIRAQRKVVAKVFTGKQSFGPLPDSAAAPTPGDAYSFNSVDALYAVNCADTRVPRDPKRFEAIAKDYEAAHPTFGRGFAYSELPCATWPAKDPKRYTGPWSRKSKNTVLVVGNTFDPATPYMFAKRMARQLGNARLLTLNGFGHTSQESVCIRKAVRAYLVDGALPARGKVCRQDFGPFDPKAQKDSASREAATRPGLQP
jgi:pimeloyl-ACP methyl ester carboxylesterase